MTAPAVPRETKAAPSAPAVLESIELGLIDIGDNVRVDVGELEELAASIAEIGVQSPIKVTRQAGGRYRLVWGQRRVLASQKAGEVWIPAIVEDAGDIDAKGARRSIEQLAENLQRKDLNPIEEAIALREVLDGDKALTQEALAKRLGRSRPWVSNTLELIDAPTGVQKLVRDEKISASHVKAVRGLPARDQVELAEKSIEMGWSAHELERQAKYARDTVKEREASRKAAAKRVGEIVPLLEKVANRKTTTVGVANYGGGHAEIRDALKADGWKTIDGWSLSTVKEAGECGCQGVWRVEVPYQAGQPAKLAPACSSKEHQDASRAAREAEWVEQRKVQQAEREREQEVAKDRAVRLADWLTKHPGDLFLRRLTIYQLVEQDAPDWLVETYLKGEDDAALDARDDMLWDAICAIPEEELATVTAHALAETVTSGWNLSKVVLEAIDERAPLAKLTKGKKAAS